MTEKEKLLPFHKKSNVSQTNHIDLLKGREHSTIIHCGANKTIALLDTLTTCKRKRNERLKMIEQGWL